jgi:citrate synthase
MTYDPAFTNTANCRSEITYIDGEAGILQHRGYPIEELCEKSTYIEVAYLLVHGELPTKDQLEEWTHDITIHTFVHENIKEFLQGFRHDAHPMGMLLSAVGALSTFYPQAKDIKDENENYWATIRLIAKMPTLAAFAYRHSLGLPYNYPVNDLSYPGNFLSMMFKMTEVQYEPDPRLERALDVLWILHADHEQNCSTAAVRAVGSSQVDPYSAVAAGIAALYGPLHGGANEAVLKMLDRIGSADNIPDFLEGVKKGDERLMGFGHRVYKNYDPRARIIKKHVDEVFEVTGKNPKLDLAVELEKRALDDDYFTSRKLYPNVDFYSGLIYEALKLPTEMFTVMFAIPRTSGWVAQWLEMIDDKEQKIARPRQVYTGERDREFVPMEERG